jgi:hypothetical protein
VIDYLLGSAPTGPVTLEIRNARGALVRRVSSEDRPAAPAEPPQFADEWLPRVEPPTRHPVLNRFVWDLRYPPPPAEHHDYSIAAVAGQGTVAEPQGPLVLPGEYQVRLSVGGQTHTQPLRVELDPRVRVADSSLVRQLALAIEIWNAMAEQQALQGSLRSLGAELRSLPHGKLDGATRASVGVLVRVTDSLARGVRSAGGELAALATTVESADREPTEQARDVFADLRDRVRAGERRWQRVLTSELPALEARLKRQGVAALQLPAQTRDSIAGP